MLRAGERVGVGVSGGADAAGGGAMWAGAGVFDGGRRQAVRYQRMGCPQPRTAQDRDRKTLTRQLFKGN